MMRVFAFSVELFVTTTYYRIDREAAMNFSNFFRVTTIIAALAFTSFAHAAEIGKVDEPIGTTQTFSTGPTIDYSSPSTLSAIGNGPGGAPATALQAPAAVVACPSHCSSSNCNRPAGTYLGGSCPSGCGC
jgi:hypothetical protein